MNEDKKIKEWILNNCFIKNGSIYGKISSRRWWEIRKKESYYDFIKEFVENDYIMSQKVKFFIGDIKRHECPVCNKLMKIPDRVTCSYECKGKLFGKSSKLWWASLSEEYKHNFCKERSSKKDHRECTIETKKKISDSVELFARKNFIKLYGNEILDLVEDDEFFISSYNKCNNKKELEEFFYCSVSLYMIENRMKSLNLVYDMKEINRKLGIERAKKTFIQRIGRSNYDRINSFDWMNTEYVINNRDVFDIADELGVHVATIWKYLNNHNIKIRMNHGYSQMEKDLYSYVCNIVGNNNCINNTRNIISPYELDIYVPNNKFAIEFNGLYYHSFGHVETTEERNYHKIKTDMCTNNDISLFHIFEHEWIYKQDIIKSMIKNKLGKSDNHIGARKCVVDYIDRKTAKDFFNNNHLQGWTNASKIMIGLFYDNLLISAMTFSIPRFDKNNEWELLRFANLVNYQVQGGASKILSFFKKNHKGNIVSYSDNRYSDGGLYKTLGFNHISDVPVRYFYTKRMEIFNRMKFQKSKLNKQLDFFDPSLTEAENMFNNGYRRIWDCGKKVFVLNV